jgi:hypothetical protein
MLRPKLTAAVSVQQQQCVYTNICRGESDNDSGNDNGNDNDNDGGNGNDNSNSDEEGKYTEPKSLRINQRIERPQRLIFTDGIIVTKKDDVLKVETVSEDRLEQFVKYSKFIVENGANDDTLLLRDSFGRIHSIRENENIPRHSLANTTLVTVEQLTKFKEELSKSTTFFNENTPKDLFVNHAC